MRRTNRTKIVVVVLLVVMGAVRPVAAAAAAVPAAMMIIDGNQAKNEAKAVKRRNRTKIDVKVVNANVRKIVVPKVIHEIGTKVIQVMKMIIVIERTNITTIIITVVVEADQRRDIIIVTKIEA